MKKLCIAAIIALLFFGGVWIPSASASTKPTYAKSHVYMIRTLKGNKLISEAQCVRTPAGAGKSVWVSTELQTKVKGKARLVPLSYAKSSATTAKNIPLLYGSSKHGVIGNKTLVRGVAVCHYSGGRSISVTPWFPGSSAGYHP